MNRLPRKEGSRQFDPQIEVAGSTFLSSFQECNALHKVRGDTQVIKIPPFCYLHVLDKNKNVTRVEIGPQTFTCLDNVKVVNGPVPMLVIPPQHYCIIENPVARNPDGEAILDKHGQAQLLHGDFEVRSHTHEPFPLYPGENLRSGMQKILNIEKNEALHLRAVRNFHDGEANRQIGDEWLLPGPASYIPKPSVEVVRTIEAILVQPGHAVRLRSRRDCLDMQYRKRRKSGEEWLMTVEGAYIPGVDEEFVTLQREEIIKDTRALHLKANNHFVDIYGTKRNAGDEWLITIEKAKTHMLDVHETLLGYSNLIVLTNDQYCTVTNPTRPDGSFAMGERKLIKGPAQFFLQPPHETSSISSCRLLSAGEALVLQANEEFDDHVGSNVTREKLPIRRRPGDKWRLYGPIKYCSPLEVTIKKSVRSVIEIESFNVHLFEREIVMAVFAIILSVILLFGIGNTIRKYS